MRAHAEQQTPPDEMGAVRATAHPGQQQAHRWRPSQDFVWVVGAYVTWKLIIHLINTCAPGLFGGPHPGPLLANPHWLQYTAFWDGGWYSKIALEGYGTDPKAPAFFPLFPLLLRLLTKAGFTITGASFVLNSVCGLVAVWCLYQLAKDHFSGRGEDAKYVVLLFLASPTAYFLAMVYSEALYCALSFGAILSASRNRFLAANILVGLASAVRGPAVVVGVLVAILYLRQRNWSWRRRGRLDRAVATFSLAPAGLLGFMAYQHWRFHNAFETVAALKREPGWQRSEIEPNVLATAWHFGRYLWHQVVERPDSWQLNTFQTFALAWGPWMLAVVILVIGCSRRSIPSPLVIFVGLNLYLIGINGNFLSADRYVLPLFPLYFVVVDALRTRIGALHAWLAIGLAGEVVMLLLFSTRQWTG